MASSLQDQLLKTGLADSKKAKKLAKEKRKEANLAKHAGEEFVDENKLAARQALAEKVQRDRELNEALNSLSLIHISEPTRHDSGSRMPSYA